VSSSQWLSTISISRSIFPACGMTDIEQPMIRIRLYKEGGQYVESPNNKKRKKEREKRIKKKKENKRIQKKIKRKKRIQKKEEKKKMRRHMYNSR
jgi:hypothetical protein